MLFPDPPLRDSSVSVSIALLRGLGRLFPSERASSLCGRSPVPSPVAPRFSRRASPRPAAGWQRAVRRPAGPGLVRRQPGLPKTRPAAAHTRQPAVCGPASSAARTRVSPSSSLRRSTTGRAVVGSSLFPTLLSISMSSDHFSLSFWSCSPKSLDPAGASDPVSWSLRSRMRSAPAQGCRPVSHFRRSRPTVRLSSWGMRARALAVSSTRGPSSISVSLQRLAPGCHRSRP